MVGVGRRDDQLDHARDADFLLVSSWSVGAGIAREHVLDGSGLPAR